MYDYTAFADFVGTSMKATYGPFFSEPKHKEAFNQMVDAKVKLNKQLFEGVRDFTNELGKAYAKSSTT